MRHPFVTKASYWQEEHREREREREREKRTGRFFCSNPI